MQHAFYSTWVPERSDCQNKTFSPISHPSIFGSIGRVFDGEIKSQQTHNSSNAIFWTNQLQHLQDLKLEICCQNLLTHLAFFLTGDAPDLYK